MLGRALNLILFGIVAVLFQQYVDIAKQCKTLHQTLDNLRISATKPQLNSSLAEHGTSVWCKGKHFQNRICHFQNLCYLPKTGDFVALHSVSSVFVGIPEKRFENGLVNLLTVLDHNLHSFNYVDLPANALSSFNVQFIDGFSIIFARFMPSNLFHIFHDDLMPLFFTLRDELFPYGTIEMHTKLIFMDDYSASEGHSDLFSIFSSSKFITKSDFSPESLICFENSIIGLTKHFLWYQYGFHVPQSPLPNIHITGRDVREFSNFFRKKLNILVPEKTGKYGVLLSRKLNRLIINEKEIIDSVQKRFDLPILKISLDEEKLLQAVSTVSNAVLVLGMHGALLTLATFMKPGSVLIELFPYAVNPENYTPYKTLVNLPGLGVRYFSWRNVLRSHTITHPERDPMLGGIHHLGLEQQHHIKESKTVQPHLCCHDPSWLFRIYQDTSVEVTSLMDVVAKALDASEDGNHVSEPQNLYPTKIYLLLCKPLSKRLGIPSLQITWKPPWNLRYLPTSSIRYELWLQENMSETYIPYLVSATQHVFKEGLTDGTSYNIWVRTVLNETMYGPFNDNYVQCVA